MCLSDFYFCNRQFRTKKMNPDFMTTTVHTQGIGIHKFTFLLKSLFLPQNLLPMGFFESSAVPSQYIWLTLGPISSPLNMEIWVTNFSAEQLLPLSNCGVSLHLVGTTAIGRWRKGYQFFCKNMTNFTTYLLSFFG